MRAKLVGGCLVLFGLAVTAQAGPRIAPATGMPVGAFAREEALTVIVPQFALRRVAATNASSIDPTLDTRLPFTNGRTRPMFSDPDSTIRPSGVAGPKIYQPALSTFVTVAR